MHVIIVQICVYEIESRGNVCICVLHAFGMAHDKAMGLKHCFKFHKHDHKNKIRQRRDSYPLHLRGTTASKVSGAPKSHY